MNKEAAETVRSKLFRVHEKMEDVRSHGMNSKYNAAVQDAISLLGEACGVLLAHVENGGETPAVGTDWTAWLGARPVGSFSQDCQDDVWRKTEHGWRCWDPKDRTWDSEDSDVWELLEYGPFTAADDPSAGKQPRKSRADVIEWLDARPVGTVVNDRDGDPWRKTSFGRWESGQGGTYAGGTRTADDVVHWGPFALMLEPPFTLETETEMMPKIKVGDVLTDRAQISALDGRWDVLLRDRDGDAWLLRAAEPDHGIQDSGWYCTHPDVQGAARNGGLTGPGNYLPCTVLYLPED